jgi:hypothetical protein
MLKKTLLATLVVASLGTAAVAPTASADVFVRVAPPAPRVEVVPEARHGYVWVPGYWDYRGHRHVWVAGTYVHERPGYRYEAPHWVAHDGGWRMEHGRWSHADRDHDGVPDRYDHDRDGDGVPNAFDRAPDNRHFH